MKLSIILLLYKISLSWYITTIIVESVSSTYKEDGNLRDDPLYLTPYIKNNRSAEGRKLAQVNDLGWNIISYSGLLTVDETLCSHMFFWYFPSERNPHEVPLLLWFNGYSTASSYGIFLQNGPFEILNSGELKPRNTSWQKYFHVLYIDNPLGVGFSTTDSEKGYTSDFNNLGENLHKVTEQFLELFSELKSQEIYITGLSLAGKYTIALANKINEMKSFNLKGVFLGNPFLDPFFQISQSTYLLQLGFIGNKQKNDLKLQEDELKSYLSDKNFLTAYKKLSLYLGNIQNITGLESLYNYNSNYIDPEYFENYISSESVRKALHLGNIQFNNGSKAMSLIANIFFTPVTRVMAELLKEIKILIYVGQMDIVCAYPMIANTLESIKWKGQQRYIDSEREKLYADDSNYVWGYRRNYDNLTDVLVRKASHSAVTDQPEYIFKLLLDFTNYQRFNSESLD